jgi:hypothetical protein
VTTVALLHVRSLGRLVDRATGSPLARRSLLAAAGVLPVLVLVLSVVDRADSAGPPPGPPFADGAASLASATIASLCLGPAVAAMVVLPVLLAWRVDAAVADLHRLAPAREGRWLLVLAAPVVVVGIWSSWTAVGPLLVVVADSDAAVLGRTMVVLAVLAAGVAAATVAATTALALSAVLDRWSGRHATTVRGVATAAAATAVAWGGYQAWRFLLDRFGDADRAEQLAGSLPVLATLVLVGSATATGAAVASAARVRTGAARSGSSRRVVGMPIGVAPRCLRPAIAALAWLRQPSYASLVASALLLWAVGLLPDTRALAPVGLFALAVSLVGVAAGAASQRDLVAVSPVRATPWFVRNGVGAMAAWGAAALTWTASTAAVGLADPLSLASACSVVAATTLVLGCAFAGAAGSGLGAESAQLAAHVVGGAVVLGLARWGSTAAGSVPVALVVVGSAVIVGSVGYGALLARTRP